MGYQIEEKLQSLGLSLPPPRSGVSNRLGAKRARDTICDSRYRILQTVSDEIVPRL